MKIDDTNQSPGTSTQAPSTIQVLGPVAGLGLKFLQDPFMAIEKGQWMNILTQYSWIIIKFCAPCFETNANDWKCFSAVKEPSDIAMSREAAPVSRFVLGHLLPQLRIHVSHSLKQGEWPLRFYSFRLGESIHLHVLNSPNGYTITNKQILAGFSPPRQRNIPLPRHAVVVDRDPICPILPLDVLNTKVQREPKIWTPGWFLKIVCMVFKALQSFAKLFQFSTSSHFGVTTIPNPTSPWGHDPSPCGQASLMRGVAWGKRGGAPQLMASQEPCQL